MQPNVNTNSAVNAAQSQSTLLPDNFDANNLKEFLDNLVKNAPPGDRAALEALVKDLDKLAEFSAGDAKGGLFGKIIGRYRENINENLVPFLEALAENPGAFGQNVPTGMSLDKTMEFIVDNAPPHLQPLLRDTAKDIESFTKSKSEQGREIADLMAYLVNRGNTNVSAANGESVNGMTGASPGGVGSENIVSGDHQTTADQAKTLHKTSEALNLISEMLSDPSKLTTENIAKATELVIDIVSDIAAAGGDTQQAEAVANQLANMKPGDASAAAAVQASLSDLLMSQLRLLQNEDGRENSNGGAKPVGGAAGGAGAGAAAGAGGAEGAAAGASAEGGGAAAAEGGEAAGGPEAASGGGSGGLSIFEIIAKALGDKMTSKLGEMKQFAEQISALSGSGNDVELAGLTAKLSAASQEFSLLSQSFSTTIKALGEGTKAAVRYQ